MPEELLPRFARVPASEFGMGADDGSEDERPEHRVHVDVFHISIHTITNEQYGEFVRTTGHGVRGVRELPLLVTADDEASYRELAAAFLWREGEMPRDRAPHPVALVT